MNAKFDDHFSRTAVILQGTLHGILSSPKSLFGREAISIVSITTAVLVSAQTSCSSNTLLGFICHLKLTSLKECTHKPPSKLAFFFVFCVFQLDWYLRVNWELWVWHHRIPGLIMLLGRELLCDIYCNAVSYSNCYVFSEASVYIFKYNYIIPLHCYFTKRSAYQIMPAFIVQGLWFLYPDFRFSLTDSPTHSANIFQVIFLYIHYAALLFKLSITVHFIQVFFLFSSYYSLLLCC